MEAGRLSTAGCLLPRLGAWPAAALPSPTAFPTLCKNMTSPATLLHLVLVARDSMQFHTSLSTRHACMASWIHLCLCVAGTSPPSLCRMGEPWSPDRRTAWRQTSLVGWTGWPWPSIQNTSISSLSLPFHHMTAAAAGWIISAFPDQALHIAGIACVPVALPAQAGGCSRKRQTSSLSQHFFHQLSFCFCCG